MQCCQLCRRNVAARWLDLGPQPISNRFLRTPDEPAPAFPLVIGYCPECAGVQLQRPVPAAELRPRFEWITYSEPESHLDELADMLRELPGITPASTVGGISPIDAPCLHKLRARGLERIWIADPVADLGVHERPAGIESLQQALTPETAARLADHHGRADLLVVRYLLEHAQDLARVLAALHGLVTSHGYLVIEVPDARRALAGCDYSTIWEEHPLYFTPTTLIGAVARTGFDVVFWRSFPYPLDDAAVVVARPVAHAVTHAVTPPTCDLHEETQRAERFVRQFAEQRDRYRRFFQRYRRDQGRIALLGAGHLSCAVINYFELAPFIDVVIDDHPHKQGMYMPGSRLPIRGSAALLEHDVKLCCTTVRPEIEPRVREKNQAFLSRGGVMASIFPASPSALVL